MGGRATVEWLLGGALPARASMDLGAAVLGDVFQPHGARG
jgi:hypothetical protein